MTTLVEWLKRLDAQKVLLLEIDPSGTPIYIADTAYITEPGDTPASQPYSAVIAEDGMPRLSRRLQELWGGRSVPSWGPLELATQFVDSNDLASMNLRGKDVVIYLTGPRVNVARSEAMKVLTGRIGPRSGNVDGGLTIEIQDEQARWDEIELPANQYDGTESASFPTSNIGLNKPVALGKCRNVPAVLIDQANLIYQVHDTSVDAMQAIDAVYDNGVALTPTTQYTTNLSNGTITLVSSPAGVITADVQGIKESGVTYHSDTGALIDWLARTYGGMSSGDIDISGLPTDTVGLYLQNSIKLSDVITRLMTGVLGWWGFSRLGKLKARLFAAPVSSGEEYGEDRHLSDVTWGEEDGITWSVPLRYRRNWMQIEPAASVNLDTAAWMRSEGLTSRVEDAAIVATYPSAQAAPMVETYFDTQSATDAVGTRALALFGTLRRRSKVTLPVTNPLPELGDSITLSDADVLDGDHLIVGIEDVLDGEIPMLNVEVWG